MQSTTTTRKRQSTTHDEQRHPGTTHDARRTIRRLAVTLSNTVSRETTYSKRNENPLRSQDSEHDARRTHDPEHDARRGEDGRQRARRKSSAGHNARRTTNPTDQGRARRTTHDELCKPGGPRKQKWQATHDAKQKHGSEKQ